MIIYSISYHVNEAIAEEWIHWLKEVHLPRVMMSERFFRHTLQELLEPLPLDGVRTFNLQLYTLELNHLHTYWDEDAEILDGAMIERFGEQLSYFETVMQSMLQPVG